MHSYDGRNIISRMRYASDHKRQTHQRIVEAASRLFKGGGYVGTGVDAVMNAAGLTPGAFYAHFPSKNALLAETLALSVARMKERFLAGFDERTASTWLRGVVLRYLSTTHRDSVADGCPLPALTADVFRADGVAREEFEAHLRGLLTELEGNMPTNLGSARDRALATIALCVGGLMLARAVKDRALSNRILRACRRLAVA